MRDATVACHATGYGYGYGKPREQILYGFKCFRVLRRRGMNAAETRELLRQRRLLCGAAYNEDDVAAWLRAFRRDAYEAVLTALVAATRARVGHVMVGEVAARLTQQAPQTPTVHPLNCACGGEGLLPVDEPSRLKPGTTYRAWRPCPGIERREVVNPGPEMSREEYLALNREPVTFDDRDHEWARTAAQTIIDDPQAVPLREDNPLRPLVDRYVRRLQMQQHWKP